MANGEGKPSIAVPPPDVRQGRNFAFNLPPQWQIAEEGNHVLYLRAPDQSAGIVVAGLSGLNFPLNPAAFAQHIFATVLRIAAPLRFINNWGLNPFTGYTSAEAFEVSYAVPDGQGIRPMHGMIFANVAQTYASCSGVIHLAAATEQSWPAYRDWLPQVALQVVNNGPNPYGAQGVMATDSFNQQRENIQFQNYLNWSQQTWASVAAQRDATSARQRAAMDPILTGHQWNADPWGNVASRDSVTPAVIWVNQDGRRFESPDPSFDPRTAVDPNWRRVDR